MFIRSFIIRNNISYFFRPILTNIADLTSSQTRCHPILLSTDIRKTFPEFAIVSARKAHTSYNTQKLISFEFSRRLKSTSVKESESIKQENNNVDQNRGQILETSGLSRAEKLKKAVKEYGSTVIVFHVGISLISLGTCYLLVSSGLDITKILTAIGLQDWLTKSQVASSAGTFAVAYAIHKVFTPVRITITLASVPLIVQYLRKIGFLKR